jgi:hypothetical protein
MLNNIFKEIRNRLFDFSGKSAGAGNLPETHIRAALEWFKSSLLPEGGSAALYSLMKHSFTPGYPLATASWIPLITRIRQFYPEVFTQVFGDREIDRELVKWVLLTQRRDGTFPAGYGDFMNQAPKVFNNGLIIQGLLDYYNESGTAELVDASCKSADWLLRVQSPDGSWRQFTDNQLSSNTLTAAALLRLAAITNNESYKQAGIRNIEFALELQSPKGYFRGNGFDTFGKSYTLTIAYAIAGILEASVLEGNRNWQQAAANGLIPVLNSVVANGFLVGKLDEDFNSISSYSCLPGNCLLAITGFKLSSLTGNQDYKIKAALLTDYVKKHQMVSKDAGVSGGISGSWPISGSYCSYEIPSWGVRYFTEAVMMQDSLQ